MPAMPAMPDLTKTAQSALDTASGAMGGAAWQNPVSCMWLEVKDKAQEMQKMAGDFLKEAEKATGPHKKSLGSP